MPDGEHEEREEDALRSADAVLAAAILATDPAGLGGALVRAAPGPARDLWLSTLRSLLAGNCPVRRLPLHITDERLLGGLDLAATLNAGRPVAERGLLAETDGGMLIAPMAERFSFATAARLACVLDLKEVVVERDGLARRLPARFGLVALDEGASEDDRPPPALRDRLAIHLDLDGLRSTEFSDGLTQAFTREDVQRASLRHASVAAGDDIIAALCGASLALGVYSLNAPLLALRVARIVAALGGRSTVSEEDAAAAARLVIAPRATMMPADCEEAPSDPPPPDGNDASEPASGEGSLQDLVVAAAKAAIPPGLLALLRAQAARARAQSSGGGGNLQKMSRRGRPAGVRRGIPGGGVRMSVVETLRAAAPWQPLRRRPRVEAIPGGGATRIEVRADDFRVKRLRHRAESATIFVVDASGSTALHRLAEAKGAVEMLLADCYIRRDQVALIAFGGRGAELLLPPTRSLTRARRNLADLPGGGGTPLAAGIEAAAALAEAVGRKGQTPGIVMLTDGRANQSRDGRPGRGPAEEDALLAARIVAAKGYGALVIDTSPQPHPQAARIAGAMGARYVALPHADAETLSQAVRMHAPGRPR